MLVFGVEIPLWIILLVILTVLLYWRGTSTYGTFKRIGVPNQDVYIPFIGNFGEQFTKSFAAIDMQMAKKFPGKIYGRFIGRRPTLCVADAEFFKEITIKQHHKFRNHSGLLDGEDNVHTRHVGVVKDDHWRHVRSILTPTFTSGKLKQMFPVIKDRAERLVYHLKSTEAAPVPIKDYTSGYTMDVIASTAFGMDIDSQSSTNHPFVVNAGKIMGVARVKGIVAALKGILLLLSIFVFPRFLRIFLSEYCGICAADPESVAYFTQIIDKFVEEQQPNENRENNFLSMCLPKVVDLDKVSKSEIHKSNGFTWTTEGLTKADFIANAIIFLSAGYETTATALQFFLYSMSLHPQIQEKLYSEVVDVEDDFSYERIQKLEYLDWCVSESLRMFPPVVRLDRICTEEATIKDVVVPKGLAIQLMSYAMHHDPDYWTNPETFDPSRFSPENKTEIQQYTFSPFGAGGRSCIANRLALLEIKVAVVKLIKAFTFERTSATPEPGSSGFKVHNSFLDMATPIKLSAVPR